jgi:hypothetical protein
MLEFGRRGALIVALQHCEFGSDASQSEVLPGKAWEEAWKPRRRNEEAEAHPSNRSKPGKDGSDLRKELAKES